MANSRLSAVASHLSGSDHDHQSGNNKWDNLPSFDELPKFHEYSGCAWSVWGAGDELGTVNLLTEDVVREASKEVR